MLPTVPLAVLLDEGSSSSADEIGNLERQRGHWSNPRDHSLTPASLFKHDTLMTHRKKRRRNVLMPSAFDLGGRG